ncbi:hypothetical protein [Sphingomonas sp. Leaf231]|nr:hypothetical protein [Sphingomonas sp. Leaf231]
MIGIDAFADRMPTRWLDFASTDSADDGLCGRGGTTSWRRRAGLL